MRLWEWLAATALGALVVWWFGWSWWALPGGVLIGVAALTVLNLGYGALQGLRPYREIRRFTRMDALLERSDAHAGARGEAERLLLQAYGLCRRVARSRPRRRVPTLVHTCAMQAEMLLRVAVRLVAFHRYDEAVFVTREAVALRHLGEDGARAEDLGRLFTAVGAGFYRAGRAADALAPEREAVSVYRGMVTSGHLAEPALADSLHSLAITLSSLDDRAGAHGAYQEAVDLYRALAAHEPPEGELRRDLARTLRNLACHLERQGRAGEAADALAEADLLDRA
ncbi:tetratricopeptide repeat protein [Nonomuraea terrae]|uniref:Tetratricopeptide repeat protein n=1 Tax=Nonomuraea terrae TaxID=2530383 RepID=A0A4R4YMA7_9ACTN|nr:tetratricopeptide repeat protein [Nonomuraea terrae]TDD45344.1 tetratricopeptide repeat protein [Nonomuraea terrae]